MRAGIKSPTELGLRLTNPRPRRQNLSMAPLFVGVDPRTLHLPPSRSSGADPYKLQRQIARFGTSKSGMPPPWVYRGRTVC